MTFVSLTLILEKTVSFTPTLPSKDMPGWNALRSIVEDVGSRDGLSVDSHLMSHKWPSFLVFSLSNNRKEYAYIRLSRLQSLFRYHPLKADSVHSVTQTDSVFVTKHTTPRNNNRLLPSFLSPGKERLYGKKYGKKRKKEN